MMKLDSAEILLHPKHHPRSCSRWNHKNADLGSKEEAVSGPENFSNQGGDHNTLSEIKYKSEKRFKKQKL